MSGAFGTKLAPLRWWSDGWDVATCESSTESITRGIRCIPSLPGSMPAYQRRTAILATWYRHTYGTIRVYGMITGCLLDIGLTEMTRTFGLELIETSLTTCPALFPLHPEFSFLLKERVCALVIKLFSPTVKVHTLVLTFKHMYFSYMNCNSMLVRQHNSFSLLPSVCFASCPSWSASTTPSCRPNAKFS